MDDGNRSLISSEKINGTEVDGADGSHIGTIGHLMIDKVSGKMAYAVMGFGGFLGLSEEHHPIPWNKLDYNVSKGGFVTDIHEEDISRTPARRERWDEDREWEERIHSHYGIAPYWL